jgi:enoyl-CoA hydratase
MADILFERRGSAGVVTLNRPKALNALTMEMVEALIDRLAAWEKDDAITRVVVTAAGERAFSAGGDIRQIYEIGRAGRLAEAIAFFRGEYLLNTAIKRFRKPYVALIDGIVMGGGAGISIHGSHRIAGDRFAFAMPEVGIGFFPDIGATWFLSRLPGEIGTYCALTGDRLRADDAVTVGIATHRVSSQRFAELLDGLAGPVAVDALIAAVAAPAGPSPVLARRPTIDRIFSGASVEAILAALDQEAAFAGADAEWARATAATIRSKSPTSLKIALRQMRMGRTLTFEQCMRTEFRIVSRIVHDRDFYEGVRAVIIDKDNAPKWQPATLAEVTEADVDRHFAPLGAQELLPE